VGDLDGVLMPVVNGKITNPILAKQTGSVYFELVDQFGREVRGWKSATDETIVGQVPATVDGAGAYTITLTGNVDINPANTRWRRRIFYNPGNGQIPYDDYLVVPTGGGPYQEEDIAQDIVALPTPTPSNEVASFNLGASSGTIAVNAVTLPGVPTALLVVPDLTRPVVFLGSVNLQHTTVANAILFAGITTAGDTGFGNAKGLASALAGAAGTAVSCSFVGRIPAHTPGSYQLCVNGPAGNVIVTGGTNSITNCVALAV